MYLHGHLWLKPCGLLFDRMWIVSLARLNFVPMLPEVDALQMCAASVRGMVGALGVAKIVIHPLGCQEDVHSRTPSVGPCIFRRSVSTLHR